MYKYLIFVATILTACSVQSPPRPRLPVLGEVQVIPAPRSIIRTGGTFTVTPETAIIGIIDGEVRAAEALALAIKERTGSEILVRGVVAVGPAIMFRLEAAGPNAPARNEAYRILITPEGIEISSKGATGLFYGAQTIAQQFVAGGGLPVEIPAGIIEDEPRFEYRGMHLDVARHFMPVEFVKKYIDLIARYKFNYFHWHLTDDQGWRIEIKKYPRLTEVGAHRPESALNKAGQKYEGNRKPVDGFYSQEKVQEIVAYARERHVTIVPEIEMPGHAAAAIAAYPQLGCVEGYRYRVKTSWGAFPEIMCPTEETFAFVENVLSEVIELFPNSPYIHVGGDEVRETAQWDNSPEVRQLMASQGLRDSRAVNSYFISRVAEFLHSRERTAIAWDEVLDGGPVPGVVIMVWQDRKRGETAAALGHRVIMTPWEQTYFDHPQDDHEAGRPSLGASVRLDDVYRFDPVGHDLAGGTAANIMGGQGCVWTEFIYDPADVEYALFPRALAMAEKLWTKPSADTRSDFRRRIYREILALDRLGVAHHIPRPSGLAEKRLLDPNEKAIVDLGELPPGMVIEYSTGPQTPTRPRSFYTGAWVAEVPVGGRLEITARVVMPSGRSSPDFVGVLERGRPPVRSQVTIGRDSLPRGPAEPKNDSTPAFQTKEKRF